MENVQRDATGQVISQSYDRAGVQSPDPSNDAGGIYDRKRRPSDWGLGWEMMSNPKKTMAENPIKWSVDQSLGIKK